MARLVGINHIALEVGDVDEALAWYGRFFEFELRGRAGRRMAFIDMGDQFIAVAAGREQPPDRDRHFGLVVDGKEAVRAALRDAGVDVQRSGSLDFDDPWGNHVQVVDYGDVQFTKTPEVLRAMKLEASRRPTRRSARSATAGWPGRRLALLLPGDGQAVAPAEPLEVRADHPLHPLVTLGVGRTDRKRERPIVRVQFATAEVELDVAAVLAERRVDLVSEVLAELTHVRHRLVGGHVGT
jgi:lactoylglutathione lyase